MTMQRKLGALSVFAAIALTGCGGAATGGPAITSVNPTSPSYSSLQFAVGTANIYGNAQVGLNVVSTFRQTNGASATGVNTPSIKGPFTLGSQAAPGGGPDPYSTALNGGPSYGELVAQNGVGGTPQTVAPGTPNCDGTGALPNNLVSCPAGLAPNTTTFGESGGVFAMGFGPYNVVAASGQGYSYQPYAQPFYGAQDATSTFMFIPWGGPPAFDPDGTKLGERDGAGSINGVDSFGDPYFLGVAEGITIFDNVAPRTGSYTLDVAISTVGNGGAVTTSIVSKTAQLTSLTPLPALTAPLLTFDGNGGASFSASLPSGVTEAYVQIVDYGPGGGPNNGAASGVNNCQGARGTHFAPVYYTIHITQAASATYTLPSNIGPNLATSGGPSNIQPSPSICTAAQNTAANGGTATGADDVVVQMFGFDYPIYQAVLGLTQSSTPQNPPIAGASGQADITISRASEQDNNGSTATPLARVHMRTRR